MQKITQVEAKRFFKVVVSDELERIEAKTYIVHQETTPQKWQERNLNERTPYFALNKLAVMAPAAHLYNKDLAELLRDSIVEVDVMRIENTYQ